MSPSCRNRSIDSDWKSINGFLYETKVDDKNYFTYIFKASFFLDGSRKMFASKFSSLLEKKSGMIRRISVVSPTLSPQTHFWPLFPFYTPWKHRKSSVLWCFHGYKMGTLARNKLNRSHHFIFSELSFTNGSRYSRMKQIEFVEGSL